MLMAKSPSENMPENRISPDTFHGFLNQHGLHSFGVFEFTAELFRSQADADLGQSGILIGNVGSKMWDRFVRSIEYGDGKPNPMNRWTAKIVGELANSTNGLPIYPFDEPYWPFQKFAQKAAKVQPSPLGILIHPEFGLWHAFRAVLVFDDPVEVLQSYVSKHYIEEVQNHPCNDCLEKPCLSSCPVGAIDENGLNPSTCFAHLKTGSDPNCLATGCEARNACPVGSANRYCQEQIQFHMKHYYGGRL